MDVRRGCGGQQMEFSFQIPKVIQAAAILLQAEQRQMTRLRLLKLLYIADRESLKVDVFFGGESKTSHRSHFSDRNLFYEWKKDKRHAV